MAQNTRLILLDDWDWGYIESKKSELCEALTSKLKFKILANLDFMLVVDIGTHTPSKAITQLEGLGFYSDKYYYQIDNTPTLKEFKQKSK